MLISASLDGNLLVWDPSTMLPKGPEKEITSKLTIKAHADGVLSMALFQAAIETPDAQPLHLCTTGCLSLALLTRLTYIAACCLHSWCTAAALQDKRPPQQGHQNSLIHIQQQQHGAWHLNGASFPCNFAGGDNKTSVWDVGTWKEVPTGRGKPFAKHPVTSVVYSSRAGTSSLATPSLLLSSDEGPAVWGM